MEIFTASNNNFLQSDMSWLYYVMLTYAFVKVANKQIILSSTVQVPAAWMILFLKLH